MSEFNLRIVTPFKLFFDGKAEGIILTTTEGQMMILPKHINFTAELKVSDAKIKQNGNFREITIAGGIVSMLDNVVTIITHAAEFVDEIDVERAELAKQKAEECLKNCAEEERLLLEYKLKKAINRISAKRN